MGTLRKTAKANRKLENGSFLKIHLFFSSTLTLQPDHLFCSGSFRDILWKLKRKEGKEEFPHHLFVQDLPLWNKSWFCSIPPIGQLKLWIQKCNSELLQNNLTKLLLVESTAYMFCRVEANKKDIYSRSRKCLLEETFKHLIILVKVYRCLTSVFLKRKDIELPVFSLHICCLQIM